MITLEIAKKEDCKRMFHWRNHPKVWEFFFDPRELDYPEHKKWFENSLARDDRIILMAFEDGLPVGVLRFDLKGTGSKTAEIDIYVAPEFHNRGLGRMILDEGEEWARKNTQIRTLVGRVREENNASVRMFKNCGFESYYILFKKELG